jgi:hypothetical protein
MQQLDIFADSRDRVLVNFLAEALARDDTEPARAAAEALRSEFPDDRHLAPAALLIEALALEQRAADTPLADATAALAAHRRLEHTLHPAALAMLGREGAGDWLAKRWQALARRAHSLPFDIGCAEVHAAALWLQGRAWAAAAEAVQGIESWRRKPQPLAWMAQASWHQSGPDSAWPLLAELAWMAPQRMPALLALLPDKRLHKLARDFESALEDEPDWAWWPAWLLVEQPLLAATLDAAETAAESAPERAFKVVRSLLRLERQGRHHDIVALRGRLKELHPALFAAYMATR